MATTLQCDASSISSTLASNAPSRSQSSTHTGVPSARNTLVLDDGSEVLLRDASGQPGLLKNHVAKACHMHGEHPDETFEISSRYSFELKVEIMAYGNDDSVFGVVATGLVEDTDFIPQFSNAFQTPELPVM